MANPPTKPMRTRPGLGAVTGPTPVVSEDPTRIRGPLECGEGAQQATSTQTRVRVEVPQLELPPVEEPGTREPARSGEPTRSDRPRRQTASWGMEPTTGTRARPKGVRSPVTVDEVGKAAVALARATRRDSAPKLVASRTVVAKAPIDTRAAFVLALVDGRNTVDAILDMSGMPVDEVKAILDRLARLGLIALP